MDCNPGKLQHSARWTLELNQVIARGGPPGPDGPSPCDPAFGLSHLLAGLPRADPHEEVGQQPPFSQILVYVHIKKYMYKRIDKRMYM